MANPSFSPRTKLKYVGARGTRMGTKPLLCIEPYVLFRKSFKFTIRTKTVYKSLRTHFEYCKDDVRFNVKTVLKGIG